ncbi:MAG: hypothetical protein UX13_C0003G0016 [Candidatus Woesebacteria bacterium GW2011_GWB1_45_5]|uniref:Uncharacterized protein n=1 Tax=Candidatus Woesebacteria bacterium GW2011_GWB1_45_5 TaxID=1618581 RepID=A0A0G1MRH9_9BACT|nr:MAG: hypothetical protein UX13_C0003G0016 [Candidatus Woesebacteria bacterium GW2011_GWB1_45_5]
MTWVCKKHGLNCCSYAKGWAEELNQKGMTPAVVKMMVKSDQEDIEKLLMWVE